MTDSVTYATLAVLVCLLLWRVATQRICHRRGGKYGDGLVLRINADWRGLPHALLKDKSKRNDAQNYK